LIWGIWGFESSYGEDEPLVEQEEQQQQTGLPEPEAPSLIGNTSPTEAILKAVYNGDTGQIRVQFPATEGTHAEIAVNAGWGENPNIVGGYLRFSRGKVIAGDWVDASGLLPGTPALVGKAQAATEAIMSGQ
jgi:hypothetical protein